MLLLELSSQKALPNFRIILAVPVSIAKSYEPVISGLFWWEIACCLKVSVKYLETDCCLISGIIYSLTFVDSERKAEGSGALCRQPLHD